MILMTGAPGDQVPAGQVLRHQDVVERTLVHAHQLRDEGGLDQVPQHLRLPHHLYIIFQIHSDITKQNNSTVHW